MPAIAVTAVAVARALSFLPCDSLPGAVHRDVYESILQLKEVVEEEEDEVEDRDSSGSDRIRDMGVRPGLQYAKLTREDFWEGRDDPVSYTHLTLPTTPYV